MFAFPGDRSGISGGTAQYSFGSDLLDFRRALAYEIVLRLLAQVRSFAANVNSLSCCRTPKVVQLLDCWRNCWTASALKRREQGPESPHCICPSRNPAGEDEGIFVAFTKSGKEDGSWSMKIDQHGASRLAIGECSADACVARVPLGIVEDGKHGRAIHLLDKFLGV
jgi:hypothetical protein